MNFVWTSWRGEEGRRQHHPPAGKGGAEPFPPHLQPATECSRGQAEEGGGFVPRQPFHAAQHERNPELFREPCELLVERGGKLDLDLDVAVVIDERGPGRLRLDVDQAATR